MMFLLCVMVWSYAFINVDALLCYQCLNGESSFLCNRTATLTSCQEPQDVCFTQVLTGGSAVSMTSYKACMPNQGCSAIEAANPSGCAGGVIDSSCTWCCQSDRCNHDRLTYSRPTLAPEVTTTTRAPDMTSQCVPVATSNCTYQDLRHCISEYKEDVDTFLNDQKIPTFCKNVPDVITCLTTALESCYHPGALTGVTSLLSDAVTSLKAQCPAGGCDEDASVLCIYNFLVKVTKVVLSPGGSCELVKRELEAHARCITLTATPCGSEVIIKYEKITAILYTAIEAVCSVLPSTIQPPITQTAPLYTTIYHTSGSYVPTTSPWRPPTTTPWWQSTTTPKTTVSTPIMTTSSLPPPTESPDCLVDTAIDCINELSTEIAQQMGQDIPDYTEICMERLEHTKQCARSNTKHCSNFVQNRIELLLQYLEGLLDGACVPEVTTVTPSVCNTDLARECLVHLVILVDLKDIAEACLYRKNATECIAVNTEGCTSAEMESFHKQLNNTLDSISDKCADYVKCSNDTIVILKEGGDSKKIYFNFTQPPSVICGGVPGCEVIVDFLPDDSQSPRCKNGPPVTQIVFGNADPDSGDPTPHCSRQITDTNWQREHSVTVTARIDFSRDGDQKRDFNIILRKVIYGVEVERRTVCTYQVIIKDSDTTAVCKSSNDPHIHTFDKLYYNNHYQGIFRLYQHNEYPYEVQVAYQQCFPGHAPTCNCAAYVRAGDTVFLVDKCARRSPRCGGQCTPRLRTALYYNGIVTPGMHIYSSKGGRIFDIVLPHGTRIRINDAETTLINIYVYPSPYDWGRSTGLCGIFDGKKNNDLIDSDGKFHSVASLPRLKHRMPREHVLSWRVDPAEYLVQGYRSDPYIAPTFCLCDPPLDQRDGAPAQTCGPEVLTETCNLNLGDDITTRLPNKTPTGGVTVAVNGRRRRWTDDAALPDFDMEYDPFDVSDSEASGAWNMTSSRQYCWDYLQGDAVIQGCLAVPNIDIEDEMTVCVDDIMTTGQTTWAPRARESVLEKCTQELQTNPVYLETAVGRTLSDRVLGSMCPGDCSGNGMCVQGLCHCNSNYIGVDCSMGVGGAIKGLSLGGGGLCDTSSSSCDQVILYADDFVDTGNVACEFTRIKVTDFDEEGNDISTRQPGYLVSYQELLCELPSRRHSYKVKVTLDGTTFSDHLVYAPFDSNCMECDSVGENNITCMRKRATCVIQSEAMCYTSGEDHGDDPCFTCIPQRSTTELTRKKALSCVPGGVAILTTIIIFIVILIIIILGCILFRKRNRSGSLKEDMDTPHDISGQNKRPGSGSASMSGDKVILQA